MRPRVGLTRPERGHRTEFRLARLLLHRAGAHVVTLRPGTHVPAELDGLVLSGGEDLADPPSRRDRFERGLLDAALGHGRPVLAICRGAQLVNVSLGGTLLQEVGPLRPARWPRRQLLPRLRVELEPDSRLAEVIGPGLLRANALHHQAVDRVAPGLRVVGRDPFGLVQAIERPTGPLLLGVQWHPELLPNRPRHRRLCAALVAAAAGETPWTPSRKDVLQ